MWNVLRNRRNGNGEDGINLYVHLCLVIVSNELNLKRTTCFSKELRTFASGSGNRQAGRANESYYIGNEFAGSG